ncbi:MAG: DUF389 domain-containing protein, partial [Pseudomonadota bacterium]
IVNEFSEDSILDQLDIEFNAEPLSIVAKMLTPSPEAEAEVEIERSLASRLGQPVELTLTQLKVDSSASAAERAQLSAARVQEEEAAQKRTEDLATRLALVAGVAPDQVTVDRTRRRALVRAERLDGASLAAYRALETRVAATEPEWTIELLPPISDLPSSIPFEETVVGEGDDAETVLGPTSEGVKALAVIEWAAARINVPIMLVGPREQAELAQAELANRGVSVTIQDASGQLRSEWGVSEE